MLIQVNYMAQRDKRNKIQLLQNQGRCIYYISVKISPQPTSGYTV